MTNSRQAPRPDVVQEVLETTAAFYGDRALAALRHQVASSRASLTFILWSVAILRRSRIGLILLLCGALIFYPRKWFAGTRTDIYAVSLTHNNTRALERIAPELAAQGYAYQNNNKRISWRIRMLQLRRCSNMVSRLHELGAPDEFVFLNQLFTMICFGLFEADLKKASSRLVLVANDHSPPTIAVLAAARTLNIKTCYIQHGPVTEHFPPLTVNLALLFSQKARSCYLSAAQRHKTPLATKICLLPPLEDPVEALRSPPSPFKICVALSKFVDRHQFQDLLARLLETPQIAEVYISRHPRCEMALENLTDDDTRIRILPRGTTAQQICRDADVCLVGNSGVAIEFLHFGCPTFYIPPADPNQYDYYGFCDAGVLPVFTFDLLDKPTDMARSFDAAWMNAIVQFDPGFAKDQYDYRGQIRDQLASLLPTPCNVIPH